MPISRSSRKRIIITMGDPSGIGPEVTLKALASPHLSGLADFLVVGNTSVLEKIAGRIGVRMKGRFLDIDNVSPSGFLYGKVSGSYGKASIDYIDRAIYLLNNGMADCLVTAPINKVAVVAGGVRGFEGHTEYLAEKTGSKNVAMMFVGKSMKITLATRHISLSRVPGAISVESISRVIRITHKYLKEYFGIRAPRIGIAGLNPHAGEGGLFGTEEERIIAPAIRRLSRTLKGITGPVPPDIIFNDCLCGKYDACVSMYHDQGLIPFKLLHFKDGVNMTLGLPFVRTSPDHGTAFNIAGKGKADPSSMIEAIKLACRLARCSRPPR